MIVKKPSIFIYTHLADEAICGKSVQEWKKRVCFMRLQSFRMNVWKSFPIKRHGIPCWDPESGFWNGRLSENAGA